MFVYVKQTYQKKTIWMPITGEQLRQLMTSSNNDEEFRERLSTSSNKFMEIFQEWVEKKAIEIAHRRRRTATCNYPLAFNERLHGFRISTYIKGFRTSEGGFDSSRFLEIDGYSQECPTPFEKVRKNLSDRGIHVEDISDPVRGLGFWLKITF